METSIDKKKFIKLELIGEIFTGAAIVFGLLIIQLPLGVSINKPVIYAVAAGVIFFSLVWHQLLPRKFSGAAKNYIESIIDIFAIATTVHFSGGPNSYLTFLYFLPNMDTAVNMGLRRTIILSSLTSLLILGEAIFNVSNGFSSNLSLAALRIWSIFLVTFYGRFLFLQVKKLDEEEQNIKVDKVREINKLKEEFVFLISRKFIFPINSIKNNLKTLFRENIDKETFKTLKIVEQNTQRLKKLVDDLVNISEIEEGTLKLESGVFNLREVAKETIESLKLSATKKNLELEFSGQGARVTADPLRVREVISNLVDNAIKYTNEFGRIEADIYKKGHSAIFSVKDDGIGMPKEATSNLFTKFFRIESGKVEKEGFGLGLFICKELVERMGGKIWFESTLGKGSIFTFSLPLASRA